MNQYGTSSSSLRWYEYSLLDHVTFVFFARFTAKTVGVTATIRDDATAAKEFTAENAKFIAENVLAANVINFHLDDLEACLNTTFTSVVASFFRDSLFQTYDFFAGLQPSFMDYLKHFASCFVDTKYAEGYVALDFDLNRAAILYFEQLIEVEPKFVLSSILLHLHSFNDFFGFDPNLH